MRHRGSSLGIALVLGLVAASVVAVAPAGAASKPSAPAKPKGLPGNGLVNLKWVAPAGHGSPIKGYVVTPILAGKAQKAKAFNSKAVAEKIAGLMNGKSYTFKVAARNAVGLGPMSAASAAVVVGSPATPSTPLVAPGDAQARLNWAAPASNGSPITGYVVTPIKAGVAQAPKSFSSAATNEIVTGLTNGKSYTFKIAARNARGVGSVSGISVAVSPTSAPALQMVNDPTYGPIIENAYGFTLYLFVNDGSSTHSTVPPGAIRAAWPPSTWSGSLTVGAGLDAGKITADVQTNGVRQLAYNGHLLYTFVADSSPGAVNGQNVAGFALIAPSGIQVP